MEQTSERKFQSKRRYLWAFIIGTVAFLLVFLISNTVSFWEFQRISSMQDTLAYKIFEDKLDSSFFNQSVCGDEPLNRVTQDLRFQGKIIDDLEKKFGKNSEQVLERKKFYTLVQIEHLEFVLARIESCRLSKNTILFFYSNENSKIDRSEEIGRLLDEVYLNNENNLLIYSFDIDLESELIEQLMEKYDVEESPTLVINNNLTVAEPISIGNVEKHLF